MWRTLSAFLVVEEDAGDREDAIPPKGSSESDPSHFWLCAVGVVHFKSPDGVSTTCRDFDALG
jgi:hypothetical protein